MKKYIDYLFWKRFWFRFGFILIPTWIVIPMLLGIFGKQGSYLRDFWIFVAMALWVLGIIDNDNVDSPPNPFKKQTPKEPSIYRHDRTIWNRIKCFFGFHTSCSTATEDAWTHEKTGTCIWCLKNFRIKK